MSDLIDTFAAVSGLRERTALKAAFARLVHDVVRPRRVAAWALGFDAGSCMWSLAHVCEAAAAPPSAAVPRVPLPALPVSDPGWRGQEMQPHTGAAGVRFYALRAGSAVVGALEVAGDPDITPEQHVQLMGLLRFFANLRGLIDENECDALTGLLNRKSFDESFSRIAFAEGASGGADDAAAAGSGWWLGVVDIDHFKRINDTWGHLIGDEVLLMLAQLMRSVLRDGDRIYRFGGEEFVVLLRSPDGEVPPTAFDRLRRAVAEHRFPQVGSLTVSIGCTRVRGDDTPTDAFGRADRAVYQAKQGGRDRVCGFERSAEDDAGPPAADGGADTGLVEFF